MTLYWIDFSDKRWTGWLALGLFLSPAHISDVLLFVQCAVTFWLAYGFIATWRTRPWKAH